MSFRKFVCVMIFLIMLLCFNACISYPELRPQVDEDIVWVCKEPFTYFKYESEGDDFFGKMLINDTEYDFVEYSGSGIGVHFVTPEGMLNGGPYFDGNNILSGLADYHEGYFDLEVDEDPLNFFGGDLPVMTFTRYTVEEFEEKFGEIDIITKIETDTQTETSEVLN